MSATAPQRNRCRTRVARFIRRCGLGIGAVALAFPVFAKEPPAIVRNFRIKETPHWVQSLELSAGAGYRDNVLLSRVTERASAFARSGLEWMAFPALEAGREFMAFASFEDLRFANVPEVDKEQSAMAMLKWQREWSPAWQAALGAHYFYFDQVLDASLSENEVGTVLARGHNFSLRPSVRWRLPRERWIEWEFVAGRQYFRRPLADYWDVGPRLTLGQRYGHQSELALRYQFGWRPYDDRRPIGASGRLIEGKILETFEHETELQWRHHWNASRSWRTLTRVGLGWWRDNVEGYYDFRRVQASQQLRYVRKPWDVRIQARVLHQDYAVQRIQDALSPRLDRTLVVGEVRLERALGRRFKVFAEYDLERSLSNRSIDAYVMNTGSAGLAVEF